MLRRSLTTLLLAATAATAFASTAVAAPKVIGIAEQKPDLFSDQRFLDLQIRHLRRNVHWDVLRYPSDTKALDDFMALAKARGISVLATLDASRYAPGRHRLPSLKDYSRQVAALHRRYPQIKEWSAWNEANHSGQPTYKHPDRVAQYWLAIKKSCRSCTVLAADLLDIDNGASYAKSMVRALRRMHKAAPRLWGLHNYVDANLRRTTGTRKILKAVTGNVWITETAGLVSRKSSGHAVKLPEGVTHAAATTRFILEKLMTVSSRIQRGYLYMWNATAQTTTWDSAFIGADNSERPSLGVLRNFLGR